MYDDEEIKEYKEMLEHLKRTTITQDIFESEIGKCKVFIKELKRNLRKDILVYTKCIIGYKIHASINEPYNDEVLKDLKGLLDEALYEEERLKTLTKIMRSVIKNKSYKKIINCIDTIINLIIFHNARYDQFDHICFIDNINYHRFGFIPNEACEKVNRKKLMIDIDNSLKSIMK